MIASYNYPKLAGTVDIFQLLAALAFTMFLIT